MARDSRTPRLLYRKLELGIFEIDMTNKSNIPEDAKKASSGARITAKTPAYFSFDIEVSPIVDNNTVKMPAEDIIVTKHNSKGYKDYKTGETENEMVIRFTGKSYVHKIENEKTKVKTLEHTVTKKQGNWYSVSLSLPMLKKYFPGGKFSILIAPKDGLSPIPFLTELDSNKPEIPEEAILFGDDETESSTENKSSTEK